MHFIFLPSDLPNSIHATEPEVLLILPDIKRGRFRDITFAKYLQEYEEKLSEAGIKGIKQASFDINVVFAVIENKFWAIMKVLVSDNSLHTIAS